MGIVDSLKRAFAGESDLEIKSHMAAKNMLEATISNTQTGKSCTFKIQTDDKLHKLMDIDGNEDICDRATVILNRHYNLNK